MNLTNDYKLKDIIKDSIASIKKVNYRVIYFSFLVFAFIGIATMALSLYFQLTYLVPFLFAAMCLCISPIMEVYASTHLETSVKYPILGGASSTTYGFYHLIMSFVKSFFFGTVLATVTWGITYAIVSINHPEVFQELTNLVEYLASENNGNLTFTVSEVTNNLLITFNFLQVGFVFSGFLISHQKNELSNAFSSAFLNKDKRFFLFNPLRKQVFSVMYRTFKVEYRKKTFWSTLIGVILFLGGLVGGTFIGFAIENSLSTIDPFYFGAGLGFILFGFWYGFERVIDNSFIHHYEVSIELALPPFITAQMESVRAIYRQGFPKGRFNSASFPEMVSSGQRNIRFSEDSLKKYFFLYYSDKIIDVEAYTLESDGEDIVFANLPEEEKKEEVKENKPIEDSNDKDEDKMVGLFGLDDFKDEEK